MKPEFGKRKAALVVSSNDARKPIKNILLRANAKPPDSILRSQTPSLLECFPSAQSLTKTIISPSRTVVLSDLEIHDISIEGDLEGNFDYVNACGISGIITQGPPAVSRLPFRLRQSGKRRCPLAVIANDPVRQKKNYSSYRTR
ncbi:MAG: hypothetical protein MZV70_62135 [Desulfobacterales bacterium]|nr:hypothetical protein [Desulfobacterales bacterium]